MQQPNWNEILSDLKKLYEEVDQKTEKIGASLGDRLTCRSGCTDCCADDITVFEVEAQNIVHHCEEFLKEATPHEAGLCAFLDDQGACRIYEHRPYVCRTHGYPLRWIVDSEEEDTLFEYRSICPENENDEPIEELPESSCWFIGEYEGRLQDLQCKVDQGALTRINLRTLFSLGTK